MWIVLIIALMSLYLNTIRLMKNIRDKKSTYWNALVGCVLIIVIVISLLNTIA